MPLRQKEKVHDEALTVLQTKRKDGPKGTPIQLKTQVANVKSNLLAITDLVDNNHTVIFDSGRSFAVHKKSGMETEFSRSDGGWNLTLDLEAPDWTVKDQKQTLAMLSAQKEVGSKVLYKW